MDRRSFVSRLGLMGAGLVLPATGRAEEYPGRTITLISPWAAGGTNDLLARLLAQELATAFGQPAVVENKPGASGVIGTSFVARAKPDGYTLTLGSTPNYTTAPILFTNLPYDPQRDFSPITLVATVPNVLVVTPSLNVHTVEELVGYAKAYPNELNYTSVGKGSTQHLSAKMFERMAGVEMLHVPYKGTAPGLQDLLAGRVHLSFENMPPVLPLIQSGALRAIAVTSLQRAQQLPDVPTLSESGMPGYESSVWYALFAPAGMPESIVNRLHQVVVASLRKPEIAARLSEIGVALTTSSPAEMKRFLKAEIEKWAGVIQAAGVTAD